MNSDQSQRSLITKGILLASTTLICGAVCLQIAAQDTGQRMPLPKFLRNAVLADRYLSTRSVAEVMKFELVESVSEQLVKRPGVPIATRAEALQRLAGQRDSTPLAELLPWLEKWDEDAAQLKIYRRKGDALPELAELLTRQPGDALKKQRVSLLNLAKRGRRTETRQAALVSLMTADQSEATAWSLVKDDPQRLVEWLTALKWLPTESPREAIYEQIRPLTNVDTDTVVRQAAIETIGSLKVQPEATFAKLATLITAGQDIPQAARSMLNIEETYWDQTRSVSVADALVQYLVSQPLEKRSSPRAKQVVQLVRMISGRLPAKQAAQLARDLDAVTVREIDVATLKEQMRYDQSVLVVAAGRAIRLRLRNDDIMPHNLVIVNSPQARETIGIAADRMQNDRDALAKGYLPDSPAILHSTKMIQPNTTDEISFLAPDMTGIYAYLCTFPGHWSKMYGALVVVDDVAEFLARKESSTSADDLLGIKTVQWTLDDLAGHLSSISQGRSLEKGRHNFLKASCFACHRIQDQGGKIGPELTKIREKYKSPAEILTHIMRPSEKVEENYATAIVETTDGTIIQGVIMEETPDAIRLSENPLDTCVIVTIRRDKIEDISRSRLSPMPEGLLNVLVTPEEVLDLLAYLITAGDPGHPFYQ